MKYIITFITILFAFTANAQFIYDKKPSSSSSSSSGYIQAKIGADFNVVVSDEFSEFSKFLAGPHFEFDYNFTDEYAITFNGAYFFSAFSAFNSSVGVDIAQFSLGFKHYITDEFFYSARTGLGLYIIEDFDNTQGLLLSAGIGIIDDRRYSTNVYTLNFNYITEGDFTSAMYIGVGYAYLITDY